MRLIIGLPIRNEENTIKELLYSLRSSLIFCQKNSEDFSFDLYACLNNCTDNTLAKIREFERESGMHFRIITTKIPGKLNAINMILRASKKFWEENQILFFCDADILLEHSCLSNLITNSYLRKQDLQIVYAESLPILRDKSFIYKLKKYHYHYRSKIFKENWYFNAKSFAFNRKIAELFLTVEEEINLKKSGITLDPPFIDDALMSRIVQYRYGDGHIHKVASACISYMTPDNVFDMLKEQVRIKYEFYKIKRYFPELAYLNKKKNYRWKRKIDSYDNIPLHDRTMLTCYYFLDTLIKYYVQYILLPIKILFQSPQWEPIKSTKNSHTYLDSSTTSVLNGSWNEHTDWEFFTSDKLPDFVQSTVVAGMVCMGDKIIMIKTKRGWELPAGHIEHGESIFQALYREIYEETGVCVDSARIFGYIRVTNKKEKINKSTGMPYPHLNYIPYFLLETHKIPTPHTGSDVLEVAICSFDSEIVIQSSAYKIILEGQKSKNRFSV